MAGGPQDLSELEKDPRLFLYTSLTAGSSHIVTATSRIETILRANRIPFQYIDTATDEKAKRLWVRRAGKRKLPALVKEGFVIGDLEQVEEWNEFGELKEAIGPCPPAGAPVAPPALPLPVKPTATAGSSKITPPAASSKATPSAAPKAPANQQPIALPGAAEIAARNNPLPKSSPDDAVKPETMTSAPAEKEKSINAATAAAGSKIDHLSAPPSAVASGTATPAEKKDEESTTAAKAGVDHLSAPASAFASGTATPAEKGDVEKSEAETKIAEESFKESPPQKIYDDLASVISSVEGLQVGDGAKVGEQEAKKAEDATKSVED